MCYEYGGWQEEQWRYAVIEEEEEENEVKLPEKIEMEVGESESYGQWQFRRTQSLGKEWRIWGEWCLSKLMKF